MQFNWNQAAAAALQTATAAYAAKAALAASPDWWQAKALADEERRADMARREAQLAAKEAERKREFEKALLEQDRARRTGVREAQ